MLILKTQESATITAKVEAIRIYEKVNSVVVDDNAELKDENNWLVTSISVICDCGETNGLQVTYFKDEQQYTYNVGYCSQCGAE